MPCCDCSRQNGSQVGRHRRGVLQELVVRRVLLLAVCDLSTATSHARCHGIWCDCDGCTPRVRGHAPLTTRSSLRINELLTFRSNRILLYVLRSVSASRLYLPRPLRPILYKLYITSYIYSSHVFLLTSSVVFCSRLCKPTSRKRSKRTFSSNNTNPCLLKLSGFSDFCGLTIWP